MDTRRFPRGGIVMPHTQRYWLLYPPNWNMTMTIEAEVRHWSKQSRNNIEQTQSSLDLYSNNILAIKATVLITFY